jgi:hypothetical protein
MCCFTNAIDQWKKEFETTKKKRRRLSEIIQDWWNFFDVNHAVDEDKWRYQNWKNEQTLHSVEMYGEYDPEENIENISPCPLLMIVADNDTVTFTEDEIELFEKRAGEPKKLVKFNGDHFSAHKEQFQLTAKVTNEWFIKYLQT